MTEQHRHFYVQELLDLEPSNNTHDLQPPTREVRRTRRQPRVLHEALSQYIDLGTLRRLAATQPAELYTALRQSDVPPELLDLLSTMKAVLAPPERRKILSPADVVAMLKVEMAHLDQEQLRTVLLDTKNKVQEVVTVYVGSVNTAQIRVGEVYKAAVRRNCTAIILAHNHPSGDPSPSPEDILVTRQIVEAGKLLDIECLDHLIIGEGYVSMKERGLGFSMQPGTRIAVTTNSIVSSKEHPQPYGRGCSVYAFNEITVPTILAE